MNVHKLLAISAVALTVISMHFLDFRIASFVLDHAGRRLLLGRNVSSLPDGLLLTVIIASTLSWTGYFPLSRRGIADRRTRFFKLIGISLPVAFAIKSLLKWVFGRMDARVWILRPDEYAFHWFHGGQGFQGFPSGHMLVFTPLLLALWDFYPRYSMIFLLAWVGLALALMATEYHFLSDVIAGAYLGFLVYVGTRRYSNR